MKKGREGRKDIKNKIHGEQRVTTWRKEQKKRRKEGKRTRRKDGRKEGWIEGLRSD